MKIIHDGNKSILDYRYKGKRYRPVLGYNLTPDEEQEALVQVLTNIHRSVNGPITERDTFAGFVPSYQKYIEAKGRDKDGRNDSILRCHLIPFFGLMRLREITLDDGLNYLKARKAANAASGTIARECAVLDAVLNFAVDSEVLDKNRMKRLPVPLAEGRERTLEGWELLALLSASNPDVGRLIMAALMTGLRESKLIESCVAWTKTKSDGVWMYPSPGSTKKGVPKEVALNSLAVEALHGGTPRISGRFFARWANGNNISEVFKAACTRAGVHDCVFHDLRHTFSSWLTALGTDYVVVEKMLGHTLPGTGELYIHEMAWAPRMREAVTKLDAYTRNLLANPEIRAEMVSRGHCPNTNQSLSTRKIS